MKHSSIHSKKIGLLGGGQLGRMIIQDAISYNLDIHVLDNDEKAPCSTIATTFRHGNLNDYDTVVDFGMDKDIITVEIENVNVDALEYLESLGKEVYPQPRVLRIIKDKGLQKQFYIDNNLPTSSFEFIDNKQTLARFVDQLPAVNKLRTGGYDGKGVQIIQNASEIDKAFDEPSILEQFVPFTKELSVIVARNKNKEIISYPAVECEFSKSLNLVEFLFAPATISNEVETKAQAIAKEVIEKLDMVGLLAVEFFLLENGELLINEIAPRPHNSGHHTIECNYTSQFEQHLRSILNMPLGSTDIILPGVMINLLGADGHQGEAYYDGLDEAVGTKGVYFHLYGKKYTKPHRKMGHITVALQDLDAAKSIARKLLQNIKVIAK